MHLVFDTNMLSYVIRKDPRGPRVRDLAESVDAVISFQTFEELWRGAFKAGWREERTRGLRQLLDQFDVRHSDEALALRCAQLRADQDRRGHPMAVADAWIAATALVLGCPLVTNDLGFQRAQVSGLVLVDVDVDPAPADSA